jgi:hypothetical protein
VPRRALTVIDPATASPPGRGRLVDDEPRRQDVDLHAPSAIWTKQFGDAFEDQGPVKASDFVGAWLRLDPNLKSPHAHLDAIPDARVYATESCRGSASTGCGGSRPWAGRERDAVRRRHLQLRQRRGAEMRRCGGMAEPAVQDLLAAAEHALPEREVRKAIEALKAQAKRSVAAADDAKAHLGVDRGFFAKDDKTLVVQVAGPSPWLLSLLARAPLVPARMKTLEKKRELAFQGYNSPRTARTSAPRSSPRATATTTRTRPSRRSSSGTRTGGALTRSRPPTSS